MKILLIILINLSLYAEGAFKVTRVDYFPLPSDSSLVKVNNNHEIIYSNNGNYIYINLDSKEEHIISSIKNIDSINISDSGIVYGKLPLGIPYTWDKNNGIQDFTYKCSPKCLGGTIYNIDKQGTIYGNLDFDDQADNKIPFIFKNNILNKITLPFSISTSDPYVSFQDSEGIIYGKVGDYLLKIKDNSPYLEFLNHEIGIPINRFKDYLIGTSIYPTYDLKNKVSLGFGYQVFNDQVYYDILNQFNLRSYFKIKNKTYEELDSLISENNGKELIVLSKNTFLVSIIKISDQDHFYNYSASGKLKVVNKKIIGNTIKLKGKNNNVTLIYKVIDAYGKPVKNARVIFDFTNDERTKKYGVRTDKFGKATIKTKLTNDYYYLDIEVSASNISSFGDFFEID